MGQFWGDGGLYGAWCSYLDRWSSSPLDLAERPPKLDAEDFNPATWERLMMRIQDAINIRLKRWEDALVRSLQEARDEFSWGRAIGQSRPGLRSLMDFARLPELPKEVRDALGDQIVNVINNTQQQLEDDAQADLRQGRNPADAEIRLRQLRNNSLRAVLTATGPAQASSPLPGIPDTVGGPRRRQILID